MKKNFFWILSCFFLAFSVSAGELDDLLNKIKKDRESESVENRKREEAFLARKSEQAALLRAATTALNEQEALSRKLKSEFDAEERKLSELETKLTTTMGTLGELFGVVRQVAGDAKGQFSHSLVSLQLRDRIKFVQTIAERKKLPNINELEKLWYELQREMTETGKVVRFKTQVTAPDGSNQEQDVIRVGAFNVVSDGRYLQYLPETKQLVELGRQPARRFVETTEDLFSSSSPFIDFGLDPSRGAILALLVQAPSLLERIAQGGVVGYVILVLLLIGVAIVGERLFYLVQVKRKVDQQLKDTTAHDDNPLGRILKVYEQNKTKDVESLELRLDEAILQNVPALEARIKSVKMLAAVAPLLGLLGTVTGMIATFQSITLFGTGDPKLMAGGISQALVTTVLGLCAAIPLLLLHSIVSGKSRSVVQVLEEQSAGFIAEHAEKKS